MKDAVYTALLAQMNVLQAKVEIQQQKILELSLSERDLIYDLQNFNRAKAENRSLKAQVAVRDGLLSDALFDIAKAEARLEERTS